MQTPKDGEPTSPGSGRRSRRWHQSTERGAGARQRLDCRHAYTRDTILGTYTSLLGYLGLAWTTPESVRKLRKKSGWRT